LIRSETTVKIEWQSIFFDTRDIIDPISPMALKLKLIFDASPQVPITG
jgi:hypothetical protein